MAITVSLLIGLTLVAIKVSLLIGLTLVAIQVSIASDKDKN